MERLVDLLSRDDAEGLTKFFQGNSPDRNRELLNTPVTIHSQVVYPIHLAILAGNFQILKMLLAFDVDINVRYSESEYTPIMLLVATGMKTKQDRKNGFSLLLSMGCDLTARDAKGWNIAHHLVSRDYKKLIDHMISLDRENLSLFSETTLYDSNTPVLIGIASRSFRTTTFLLSNLPPQEVFLPNSSGVCPIKLAIYMSLRDVLAELLVLFKSDSSNTLDPEMLFMAISLRDLASVEQIVKAFPEAVGWTLPDSPYTTPYNYAANSRAGGIVEFLGRNGGYDLVLRELESEDPDIDLVVKCLESSTYTPIAEIETENTVAHLAALKGIDRILTIVRARQPEMLSARNAEGLLPIHCLIRGGFAELATIYISKLFGARLSNDDLVLCLIEHIQTDPEPTGHSLRLFETILNIEGIDPFAVVGGTSPVHQAIIHDIKEFLHRLFGHAKVFPNIQDSEGRTPILLAIASAGYENLDTVRFLLKYKPRLDIPDRGGWYPIHHSIKLRYWNILEVILDHGSPMPDLTIGDATYTCAHLCLLFNEITSSLKVLHTRGHRIDRPDSDGNTIVHHACRMGKNNFFAFAWKNGLDLNAKNARGKTPLHLAAENTSNINGFKMFVNAGCDPWGTDAEGRTPLEVAASRGFLECVKFYSTLGEGNTAAWSQALLLAATHRHSDVFRFINTEMGMPSEYHNLIRERDADGCEPFIQLGFPGDCVDSQGYAPIHLAVLNDDSAFLSRVLSTIEDANVKCGEEAERFQGMTAIQIASALGHIGCIDVLLDVEGVNLIDYSPLNATPRRLLMKRIREVEELESQGAPVGDLLRQLKSYSDSFRRIIERNHAIHEIKETQAEMVRVLCLLVNDLDDLRKQNPEIPAYVMEAVVSNLPELVRRNKEIADELVDRCSRIAPRTGGISRYMLSIFDDEFLSMCTRYSNAYPAQRQMVKEVLSTKAHPKTGALRSFFKRVEKEKKYNRLGITDLLVYPIQQMTRFTILIKAILSLTPEDHPEYGDTERAWHKSREFSNLVNESKRAEENKKRLGGVLESIHLDDTLVTFSRAFLEPTPTRRLIYDNFYLVRINPYEKSGSSSSPTVEAGEPPSICVRVQIPQKLLQDSYKNRYIVLLDSALLVCKKSGKGFKLEHFVEIRSLFIKTATDSEIVLATPAGEIWIRRSAQFQTGRMSQMDMANQQNFGMSKKMSRTVSTRLYEQLEELVYNIQYAIDAELQKEGSDEGEASSDNLYHVRAYFVRTVAGSEDGQSLSFVQSKSFYMVSRSYKDCVDSMNEHIEGTYKILAKKNYRVFIRRIERGVAAGNLLFEAVVPDSGGGRLLCSFN